MVNNYSKKILFNFLSTFFKGWKFTFVLLFIISNKAFSQEIIASQYFETDYGVLAAKTPELRQTSGFVGADSETSNWFFLPIVGEEALAAITGTKSDSPPYSLKMHNFYDDGLFSERDLDPEDYPGVLIYFRSKDIAAYKNVSFEFSFASDGEQKQHDDLILEYEYELDGEWISSEVTIVDAANNTEIEFGESIPNVTTDNPYVTPIGAIPNDATRFRAKIKSRNYRGSEKENIYYIDNVILKGNQVDINVLGNNTLIENGQTETSPANLTDFEDVIVNEGFKNFSYDIQNSGGFELELTGDPLIELSGDTDDFVVSSNPVSPVEGGTSTSFGLFFAPSTVGEKFITVSVVNSDEDKDPYTFVVRGNAVESDVAFCDPTDPPIPNNNDSYYISNVDFGDVDNTTNYVDPDRYSYFPDITTNLNIGDSYFTRITNTTFVNEASGIGVWIDFNKDGDFEDANEEIYSNLYNANNTETSVESSFSMLIPNDALLGSVRMRIAVSQGEIPTPCGPFNSVGEVEDYDVNIVDLANANPVVEILGNGIQIANGDNTPEEIDNTDFGRREVVGGGISYSFNILNVGGLDLTLDNPPSYVEIIGDDEDFILTQIPDSTLEPISGTRFEITFNPLSEGVKSAIISIANNDSEKDPYTFSIQGEGFIPQSNMAVLGNGILIPVGDTTPSEADGTDYGNIEVTGGVVSHTFSITNLGDIDLVLNDVPLIELYGNTEDFILTQAPSNVVAPNDGTVFTIEFNPTVPGKRLLEVVINNNDPNKNPYSFNIEGFGIIDTYCGIFEPIPIPPSTSYYISNVTTDIIDNTTTYEESRYSYFPGVTPDYEIGQTYAMSVTHEREINERTGVVVWIDYNIDGDFDDANEQVYAELIEGDNQTSFTSSFNFTPVDAFASITRMRVAIQKGDFPLACGPFTDTGEIEDYLINFVLPPLNEEEIDVYGNDLRIANGDVTPSVSDNTYFGSIPIESGAISKAFQIKNSGLFELDLLGQSPYIILSGDTDHFQLTTPPISPISVNSNSEFVITFDPSEIGEKSVIVEIPNSDSDENPYRFRIQGNGVYLNDADSDLVIDDDDLDDDNDGILDVVENSDCGDSVLFKTQVFKEDFGTQSLENGTPSITSPYTAYEYLPLETGTIPSGDNSLTDGKYSVFNNISEASSWAQYDWQTIGDHTSGSTLPSEGRMMMFNTTSAQNAEYYRRELTNVEAGVPVDVSFWTLNLDIDSQDNSGRILPDIEVVIEQGGNSYSIVRSGGIPREPAGDITAWKNFTGSFIPNSTAVITIVFIDRAGSGNGNELAIDDIEVSQTQAICDVDGDGIPNKFDIDSDNDGIYDVIEAGGLDANNNGLADDDDDNSDNTSTLGIPTSAGTGLIPVETTPGNPNYISLDSDLDSCFDVIEVYGKDADPDGDGIFGEGPPSVLDNGKVADLIYISPPDGDGDLVQDYVQVSKNIVGIIRNPFEAIVLEGTNVVLSVEVDIQGEGTDVVYQWQEDRGAGFENLLNDGKYSGVHTELVRIENVTYDMTGYKYRVLIESPSYACDEDLISDEAELIIKASDLVTEKSIDNINPYVGDEILYTIIVSNMGPQEATNVSIVDVLPVEVTYVSDNVSGSYNPIDGLWTIGNLSVGSSVTLLINAMVNNNAVAIVRNQITQVNLDELDLTTNGDVLFADFIVNTVPNANNDAVTVAEDSGLTNIDVTSNDDFGGDGPSTAPIELISGSTAEGGTVVVNDNGTPTDPTDDMVGYTPKLDFYGSDSFDYKIYDVDGDVSTATVTVTVTSVNDVPMAVDDDFVTILEDSVDEIIVILENDDFGGDGPGTLVLATLPSNGTAVIDDRSTPEVTDDVVIYNPTLDYFGSDSFTYTISDSDGDTSTATVTITINPVNDEPLATDDTATTDEDILLNIAVLVNDDFGGDGPSVGPIEVTSASTSKGGTVVVNENGTPDNPTDDTIDYTPAQDFNGTDTFDYNILDVDGDISSATVTITVNPINDLPTAVDDTATMDEDGPAKTIPVAYNDDFGGDGPSATAIVVATAPTNGIATVDDNGTPTNPMDDFIIYTPNANYHGVDTIDYTIADSNGDTSTATVTITINSINDLPTANNDAVTVAEDSGLTNIDVTSNDDFGGDGPSTTPIELVSGSTAQGGTVVVNDNGTPTDPTDDMVGYTPKLDFYGTDSFDYRIYDSNGDFSVATVSVTVTSVNDIPIAGNDPNVVIVEDRIDAVLYLLNNDDFGGDGPGTVSLTTLPPNGTVAIDDLGTPDVLDDVFIYSPTPDYNGPDGFTYTITDSDGDASTATVTIEITPVDDFPLATDDTATTDEDIPLNIAVLVNDDFGGDGPSVGPIEVTSASTSQGGTVVVNENGTPDNPTDDTIDYTPAQDFNGTDTFDYNILDVDGDISSATVTITVNPINDLPTAVDDTATMDEDGPAKTIPVAYNDDFGGDGPSATAIVIATAPTNGIATVDDNTTPTNPTDDFIVYTPNANYYGVDTIDYTIADSNGDTSTATVTITINSINDLPTANNDAVTVAEDSGLTNIDVTSNDDFGGDGPSTAPIELVSGSTAQGGTVVVNDNGTPTDPTDDMIGYTPKLDFYGTDSFDYKIYDIDGDVSTATVTVTVTSVNDVPVAVGDIAVVAENSSGTEIIVLANDSFGGDGPGSSAIFLDGIPASNGVASVNDNGTTSDPTDDSIFYTPNPSFDGIDIFQYTITDNNGDTSTASVVVQVFAVDVDPIASDDTAQVFEDSGINNIDVLSNDSFGGNGPGSGPITITSTTPTIMNAIIVVNDNGTPTDPTDDSIDYTPTENFYGTDGFTYSIMDSDGDTSEATVIVTVLSENDLPTANDDSATVAEDSGLTTIDVTANDDFGGDGPSSGTITIGLGRTLSGNLVSVNDNGTPTDPTDDKIDYNPAANFNGVDSFDYTITDSDGDTSSATVTVTVTPVNDLPEAKDDIVFVFEDSPLTTINVTSNDDFGGDGPSSSAITLIGVSSSQGGIIAVNDNGTPTDPTDDGIDYTPDANYHGVDSFDYQIADANGDLSTATVFIEVISVNDLPTAVDDALTVDEDSVDTRIDVLVNDEFGGDGPNMGSITLPEGAVTGRDDTGQVNPTDNDGLITVDENGTPTDPTDDTILYSPAPNYNGLDSFTYAISDSNGDVSIATVFVTVNSINDLPQANLDFVSSIEDAPLMTIDVTVNDDFGGDGPSATPITIATGTSIAGGTITVNDNGTPNDPTDDGVDYTPLANYNGDDSFEYTIMDSNGDSSTATVVILLSPVNDVPTANDDVATVEEDSGLTTIDVTVNDNFGGDGPSIGTISLTSGNTSIDDVSANLFKGTVTVNDNGTPDDPTDDLVDYTPSPNFNGTDSFSYTITDSDGDTSSATVTVTVTSVNDLPEAKDDVVFVFEDSPLTTINVTSNDDFGGDGPSSSAITLLGVSSSQGGIIAVNDNGTPTDPTDDGIDYTPDANYHGVDSFDYQIADANGDLSTATVFIEVISVNDLPTAVDDAITVDEDNEDIRIDVLINDDFGGDGPNMGSITLPEGAVTGLDDSGLVTPSSNDGLITVDDNGTPNDPTDDSILYSPAPDYHGPDAFTYSITDSNGDTSTAMVTITVNSINDLPKAEIDFILTVEDAPLATINVTANDDFGGDGPSATPITISTSTSAAGGTIAVNDMGTPDDPTDDGIDYTPAANYYGNDSFEYTIADSDGDTSTVLVLIYLDSVNDLPTANDDSATVEEDSGLTTIDVTTNDDFGGDGPSSGTITIALGRTFSGNLVSVNDNGTPTDPTDDKIDYTPAANFNGTDSFEYTITDSDGDTSSATVTVTVTPVNDLPEAKDDVVFVFEDSPPTTINVTSNDDFGGDGPSSSAITLIGVSSNQGGIIAVNDNGTPTDPTDDGIDYTPDANYHGVDSFDYQIADANGDLSTASVFIEVISVNDLPTAVDDALVVDEDSEDIRIDVLVNDDFGGDGPNMGSITLPEGAVTGLNDTGLVTPSSNDGLITVDDNGTPNDPTDDTILYSPAPDYHGPDAFTYSITDSNGDTSTATVTITINSINDVPKAEIDFILTVEDAPLATINVTANDDFGGDGPSATPITISTSTSVAGGTIAVNDMETPDDPTDDGIDYTPAANYYGNDSFEYTIADSDGDTSTVLVLIYLDSVNDLPTANDDSATVEEDSGLTTIDVTTNDDFGGDGPSSGTITIGLGRTLSGNLVSVNDNGTPTDPTDDKIDYTPTTNFNGTDSFEYTITDSDGDTSSATVIVTVTPVLDVYDDLFATDEDVAVEIDVLQNDNDLSTSATIQFSTPIAGEIEIDTNNTPSILDDIFTYVPIEDYNGIDLFDYEICDQGNCTTAEVFISIRPKLDVYDDFYLVKTNTINPFSLYSNDNDIPNEGTIKMTLPTNGTLEYDDRGTPNNPSDDLFSYIPNTDFVGEDTFEYTICDTDNPSYCETATVTILVVYAGANDDYIEVNEDESVDIFMLQNDLDIPKSGDLTFELPINGIAELMDNDTTDDISDDYFIYTPNPDYNGEDSFIYTICDSGEYCTSAKITIDVLPIVDAFDDTVETNENTPIDVQILLNDNDVPITGAISIADPTTSTLLLGTATVMDNNTPTDISDDYVVYEPFENVYGNDQFSYTICDLNGNCSTATVFVAILPSIILSDDMAETKYETPVDIYMLDNDDFIPTDGVLEVLEPANGRVTIHDNNTPNNLADDYVTYTPNQGFYGFDEFSYTICDVNDANNCASALVTIEVLKSTTFILPNQEGSNNKGFGFSPNGDGQNDYLRIHSYDGEVFIEEIYPNFKLEIFNRWGDRLYEYSHTGGSNTPQPGWDGTSHGKRNVGAKEVLPTGTYFYTVYFNDGIRKPYSGWIYLSK